MDLGDDLGTPSGAVRVHRSANLLNSIGYRLTRTSNRRYLGLRVASVSLRLGFELLTGEIPKQLKYVTGKAKYFIY